LVLLGTAEESVLEKRPGRAEDLSADESANNDAGGELEHECS
jgi:hypothetical protein